jgi:Ca2+-binding EF-hand superfamily protein
MKSSFLLLLALPAALFAQDANPRAAAGGLRAQMIREFDKDGDGQLSGDEQTAAREEAARRFGSRNAEKPAPGSKLDRPRANGDRPRANGDRPRANGTTPAAPGRGFGGTAGGATALADFEKALEKPSARILSRYDADKDGKLSDEEKKAARESFSNQRRNPPAEGTRGDWARQLDKDGDGTVSPEEQSAAGDEMMKRLGIDGEQAESMRRNVLDKLDANKDGQIDETERAAIRDAFRKFIPQAN